MRVHLDPRTESRLQVVTASAATGCLPLPLAKPEAVPPLTLDPDRTNTDGVPSTQAPAEAMLLQNVQMG